MLQRVLNPKNKRYHRYGGRGIKVCDEWRKFIPFYEWCIKNGLADGLHLDRIDNDGNYCPQNCRFVTPKENANNKLQTGYGGYVRKNKDAGTFIRKSGVNFVAEVVNKNTAWHVGEYPTKEEAILKGNEFLEQLA